MMDLREQIARAICGNWIVGDDRPWQVWLEEADAVLEVLAKQEPVAFGLYSGWALKATYLKEHEACDQRDRRQLTADLGGSLEAYRVAPLYALPGAQPATSVPEGWKLVPVEPTPMMKTAGIGVEVYQDSPPSSDCLTWEEAGAIYSAMLAAAPEAKS